MSSVSNSYFFIAKFMLIFAVLGLSYMVASHFIEDNSPQLNNSVIYPITPVNFSSSIVIYVILGCNQILSPDLRGNFWEFQLRNFSGKIKIVYLAERICKINNLTIEMPEYQSYRGTDRVLSYRTAWTWQHFYIHFSYYRWCLRVIHDSFVNLTALDEIINELEKKHNPMKEPIFSYGVHEVVGVLYPHGGPGWLLSNKAMLEAAMFRKKWIESIGNTYPDDVGMMFLVKDFFKEDIMKFVDSRFTVSWPDSQNELIWRQMYDKFVTCSQSYNITSDGTQLKPQKIKGAVSIHMHKVKMSEAAGLLTRIPDGVMITCQNMHFEFCIDRNHYYE